MEFGDKEFTDPDCIRLAGRVVKYAPELFTFVDHPEVEATNNLAERKIRPNVVIRKISGGNRSPRGADAHENLMSLVVTRQQKDKDWFEYRKTVLNNFRDNVKEPIIVKAYIEFDQNITLMIIGKIF